MKKILIVIGSLAGGGAEKVLLDLVKKFDKKKYLIDIFLLEKEGIYLEEVQKYVNSLEGLSPRNRKYDTNIVFRKINSLITRIKIWFFINGYISRVKNDYQIEIAFLEGYSTKYIANRKNNAKKIAWVHTDLEKNRTLKEKEEEKIYGKIEKIICVSEGSKISVLKLYPNLKEKVKVIYNLIPIKEIQEKAKEKIKKENILTIVTAGRLIPVKGYDILLGAHKKLIAEGFKYKLKILGEGYLKEDFENFIKINKLEEYTELLGFRRNPYPFIKEADIYILSSRYEGFPLVLCEALILEKAIIATKCTGVLEILENGKYGELVEIESIEKLEKAIKKLILDDKLREKYRILSKERALFFNDEKVINEIQNLLEED